MDIFCHKKMRKVPNDEIFRLILGGGVIGTF